MANWDAKTVKQVVQGISENRYVLPVIQRQLVWNESKMELLLDSLLKRNSFGGIMVLEEEKGETPLFAYRVFSRTGEETDSIIPERLDQTTCLVIDGQQRLQTFFMGLAGRINGQVLFFNILGDGADYEFRFAPDATQLPSSERDDSGKEKKKHWYQANTLYDRMRKEGDDVPVAEKIIRLYEIDDAGHQGAVRSNLARFHRAIFVWNAIGISSVTVNKFLIDQEKLRIVELFRRLNDGGTRLSSFDLVASIFKGFDYRMEGFFRSVRQFSDIGISQDEVIKLIFLLQNVHAKEVTDIEKQDAEFVIDRQERILNALHGLRRFLHHAKLEDFYRNGGRSIIPLYFVAYHLFHKDEPTASLPTYFENHDINNPDFVNLQRWVYLSVLNGVFSRGTGWIPYKTGIRKILQTLGRYKGQLFPSEHLFQVYLDHPVDFSVDVTAERLDHWDRDFVFYLLYDRTALTGRDIDHVHPRSLLEGRQVPPHQIHSIANFQLLDEGTNRNQKRAKALEDWLQGGWVQDPAAYRARHLLPTAPSTWDAVYFDAFLQARTAAIVEKIRPYISDPVLVEIAPPETRKFNSAAAVPVNKGTLRDRLGPEYRDHPALDDTTPWLPLFKETGLTPTWSGRFANALRKVGIESVGDFSLYVLAFGLEFRPWAEYANLFRFHRSTPDGQRIELPTRSFGAWGWTIALEVLEKRGFDWREHLVNRLQFEQEGVHRTG